MEQKLFHVSDQPGIRRFEPRSSELTPEPVVWAVDDERLRNYLVPRDCPRVTFYAGPTTSDSDIQQFLGSSRAVVAFESGSLDRVRSTKLFCYHLPAKGFTCIDECAGYFVARIMPSLWSLHDSVVISTLQFSMIRMKNAVSPDSTSIPPND